MAIEMSVQRQKSMRLKMKCITILVQPHRIVLKQYSKMSMWLHHYKR